MPLVTVDAIVLQSFPYSETSKVLRLLTRTHGVQSLLAKGALRPRSRYGGVLESFAEGVATFHLKEGRELHTLSSFELTHSRQTLGQDLIRFGGASLAAELVLRTASEAADPALYDRLRHALSRLESADVSALESVALAESWALVSLLGFAPTLDSCLECGRPLGEEEAMFDYAAGGMRCDRCAEHGVGRRIPAAARNALRALTRGEAVPLTATAAHWRLLARYIAYHVLEGCQVRSLEFLAEALERR